MWRTWGLSTLAQVSFRKLFRKINPRISGHQTDVCSTELDQQIEKGCYRVQPFTMKTVWDLVIFQKVGQNPEWVVYMKEN